MLAPPARTASPPVPTVSAAEVVKLPVILLVPTIDNPPLVFEIVPLEFNCVQATYANVELPVTVKVPFNVEPPHILRPPAELERFVRLPPPQYNNKGSQGLFGCRRH